LLFALSWHLTSCQPEQTTPTGTQHTHPKPAAQVSASSAAGRPNVVVIMTDDENLSDMQVMPQTLNLIGAAGVTFDNFVVTYSLCCPSRATFLTGQYSHNHHVFQNGPPSGGYAALDHTNTLPVWLQSAGYVTGEIGKYLNNYGVTDSLVIPPGWTEWYASIEASAFTYYNYSVNQNGTIVRYGSTPEEYRTDLHTRQAVDFITRRAPDAATTPFFLFVSYLAPHWGGPVEPGDPSIQTPVPAPRHKGLMANKVLPFTPSFNEADVSDKPKSVLTLPLLTTTQISELQEAYRQRLESLLAVDEGVATIIGALETAGVLSNTVIIFMSDNGWFQGEHRISFGKNKPYEPALKMPLMIRGPGVVVGKRIKAPVANIDNVFSLVRQLPGTRDGDRATSWSKTTRWPRGPWRSRRSDKSRTYTPRTKTATSSCTT
jgi:arylsulfatase A-like enzyme